MDKMNLETNQSEGVTRRSILRGVIIGITGFAALLTRKLSARPTEVPRRQQTARPTAQARRRPTAEYVYDEYGRVIQITHRYPDVKTVTYTYSPQQL